MLEHVKTSMFLLVQELARDSRATVGDSTTRQHHLPIS